jgi:hypothetical protein
MDGWGKIRLKRGLSYKVPERSERERGAAPLSNLLFPTGRDPEIGRCRIINTVYTIKLDSLMLLSWFTQDNS